MKSLLIVLPFLFLVSCAPRISTSNTKGEVDKLKNAKFEVMPIKKVELKGLFGTYREIYGDDTNFTKTFQSSLKLKVDSQQTDKVSSYIIEFPSIEIGESLVRVPQGGNIGKSSNMPCCTINLHYIVKSNNGDTLLEGHALAEIGGGLFARKSVMLTNAVKHIQNFLVSYLRGKMKSDFIKISTPANQR